VKRAGASPMAESLMLLARGSRLPLEDGLGYVIVFDDITQVISAQRAVAYEVARRLAHEIKNPLTPIQSRRATAGEAGRRCRAAGHVRSAALDDRQ
jgi:hypothetical protein